MKYYLISNSASRKEVGRYFQTLGVPDEYTFELYDRPNSMTKLTNEKYPDFIPNLIFELDSKAKITDVISVANISARGFLISPKLKEILEPFNLMEHQYYEANLIIKEKKLPYYWLHLKEQNDYFLRKIDFDNSTFFMGNLARWKEDSIEISSIEEYFKIKENLGLKTINPQKLSLRNVSEDLFYINRLHDGVIISETLNNSLKRNKISGFDIKEIDFII